MSDETPTLNRQARRYAKKQGLIDDEGNPVRQKREPSPASKEPRTPPGEFIKEVRKELKLVSWPSRQEVINYSTIVFLLLVVFTVVVAFLDYGLGALVTQLFAR